MKHRVCTRGYKTLLLQGFIHKSVHVLARKLTELSWALFPEKECVPAVGGWAKHQGTQVGCVKSRLCKFSVCDRKPTKKQAENRQETHKNNTKYEKGTSIKQSKINTTTRTQMSRHCFSTFVAMLFRLMRNVVLADIETNCRQGCDM